MARIEQRCFECEAVLKTKREKEDGLCYGCGNGEDSQRKDKETGRRKEKGKRDKLED